MFLKNVGRELGVRYVLEGSVQKASDRLRINVQLVDAANGAHVWAERYDRPLQAVFTVQDDITQQIVLALRVEMWEAELARVKRIPTDNLTAYDSFLRAKALLSRPTKETTTQARQMAEKAIALDLHHTGGYIAASWVYFLEWLWQWSPDPSPLERSAERAQRAIALDPNFADAHIWMTLILNYAGRPEEAIGWAEKALRLNPRYPGWYLNFLGTAYFLTRRYEEALTVVKRALTLSPNLDTHILLTILYRELGREEEARAAAEEVLRMSPNFSVNAFGQILPFKDPAVSEHVLASLRNAGLK